MNVPAVRGYPRWIPLALGFIINAAVGMTTYSWSLFISPLNAEFGWTRTQIALAFALCCLFFGLASFPAGKLSDRFGAKRVVCGGGLLLGLGFVLTGYIQSRWQLYLTYGVMSGTGAGLIYLPPVALAPRWWPDRRAFATGIIVLGLGVGSFIMGPLAATIMNNPDLGWRYVFRWCGIFMGAASIISGLLLKAPPQDAEAGPAEASAVSGAFRDYTHAEAVRTPQFALLYLAYFCCSCAGLLVIGHIAGFGQDMGLTAWQAVGAVSALAITNAATRVFSGIFVDVMGIRRYFLIISIIQVAVLLLLPASTGKAWFLWGAAALIGWNYGAIFTLFPVYSVQYFGPTAQGANYGLLFTAWGIAGFFGPFAGGMLKDLTGTYTLPFLVAAGAGLVAVFAIVLCKAPPRKALA